MTVVLQMFVVRFFLVYYCCLLPEQGSMSPFSDDTAEGNLTCAFCFVDGD